MRKSDRLRRTPSPVRSLDSSSVTMMRTYMPRCNARGMRKWSERGNKRASRLSRRGSSRLIDKDFIPQLIAETGKVKGDALEAAVLKPSLLSSRGSASFVTKHRDRCGHKRARGVGDRSASWASSRPGTPPGSRAGRSHARAARGQRRAPRPSLRSSLTSWSQNSASSRAFWAPKCSLRVPRPVKPSVNALVVTFTGGTRTGRLIARSRRHNPYPQLGGKDAMLMLVMHRLTAPPQPLFGEGSSTAVRCARPSGRCATTARSSKPSSRRWLSAPAP